MSCSRAGFDLFGRVLSVVLSSMRYRILVGRVVDVQAYLSFVIVQCFGEVWH